jgi:hypothetical protein
MASTFNPQPRVRVASGRWSCVPFGLVKRRELWMTLVLVLYPGSFGQMLALATEPKPPVESISSDSAVLQIEIFVPKSEAVEIGPSIRFGFIDEKMAVFTQFEAAGVTTTDFTLKNAANSTKVLATLRPSAPPYTVEFEQFVSPVQPPTSPVTQQKVEFQLGKLTRVRLFDLFEVQGFYGNPQRKRP